MKKTRGKLQFFIFRIIFAPLEAKMMKNDKKWEKMKKMKKNEKKWKKWKKNPRKIAIFHFLENCNFPRVFFFMFFSLFFDFFIIFHHFSSIPPLEAKMIKKNDKKMIKKWKKLEENCNFLFFGNFLHHWKQKWWKMIKKWKNEKKWKKWKQN